FFSSRRRHTRFSRDWSSDVCSSDLPIAPPALPGGGDFPVEFVIASTAEPEEILKFAEQLQMKAMQSGMFAFPPNIDTKVDLPERSEERRVGKESRAECARED